MTKDQAQQFIVEEIYGRGYFSPNMPVYFQAVLTLLNLVNDEDVDEAVDVIILMSKAIMAEAEGQ